VFEVKTEVGLKAEFGSKIDGMKTELYGLESLNLQWDDGGGQKYDAMIRLMSVRQLLDL